MKLIRFNQKFNQLRVYYLLIALKAVGGVFTHATYYIYLTTELGLSNSQAMFLDTILFASVFFLEVPTGIIGDKYGRKFSFIVAQIFLGLSHLMYFLSGDYTILLIGAFIFAVGIAFQSGAFEAWVIDHVSAKDNERVFISKDISNKLSIIFIPIVAVFIAEATSYAVPYLISFIFCIITAIIGFLFMRENEKKSEASESAELKGLELLLFTGKDSLGIIKDNATLKYFLLSFLFSSLAMISINSYSSKLIEIETGSELIGVILAISSLVSILFSIYLSKKKLIEKTYFGISLTSVVALVLIGIVSNPLIILFLFVIQVAGLSVFEVERQKIINRNIDRNRATVLSIYSFAGSISGVIGTLLFGFLADITSIKFTFSVAGILILIAITIIRFQQKSMLKK